MTRRAADSVLVARFRATGLTSRKMMQAFARAVLAVLLAHLSADFPLQPDSILQAKKNGFDGYLAHGAIHLVTVIVALELFTNLAVWSWYPLLLVLGYVASHPVLDYLRQAYLKTRHLQDSTGPFVVDQALHVVTAVGLAWAITGVTVRSLIGAAHWSEELRWRILLLAVTYTAVIFAGGYLVRSMTRSLTEDMPAPEGEDKAALHNAGL